MRLQSYSLLALLAATAPAASARAQALSPYDVFVFNTFAMTSTEVNGCLAVSMRSPFPRTTAHGISTSDGKP